MPLRVISAMLVYVYGWEGLTALGRECVVLVTRLKGITASMESAAQGGRPVDVERYVAVADLQHSALDELEESNALTGYRQLRQSDAIKRAVEREASRRDALSVVEK